MGRDRLRVRDSRVIVNTHHDLHDDTERYERWDRCCGDGDNYSDQNRDSYSRSSRDNRSDPDVCSRPSWENRSDRDTYFRSTGENEDRNHHGRPRDHGTSGRNSHDQRQQDERRSINRPSSRDQYFRVYVKCGVWNCNGWTVNQNSDRYVFRSENITALDLDIIGLTETHLVGSTGVTVYLVPPPPGILSPGTLYPRVKYPTLVYLVPGDTLPRGKVSPSKIY